MVSLILEKKYPDFVSFYKDTEEVIYRKIIDAFESNDKSLKVVATVEGIEFTTDFEVNDKKMVLWKNTLFSFFEKNEDYEMCNRLTKHYNRLIV